jgi:hypothetical protein
MQLVCFADFTGFDFRAWVPWAIPVLRTCYLAQNLGFELEPIATFASVQPRAMSPPRYLPYIAGPEVYWALICLAVYLLGWRNSPPSEAGNRILEQLWYWLPLLFTPLTFALFLVPGAGRWLLLLRIDLATLVGLFVASAFIVNAVDYRDSRNSGGAAGFIVSVSLGAVILAASSLIAAIVLWWRARSAS